MTLINYSNIIFYYFVFFFYHGPILYHTLDNFWCITYRSELEEKDTF